jgi:glycine cleavage system H protein
MSTILGLLTAAILIGIGALRARKTEEHVAPVIVRRFVHPGHAWVRETEDGDVLIGIDDFAQSVLGSVDAVSLPRTLKSLKQGGTGFVLGHGSRSIRFISPVSGRVMQRNDMVLANPTLVNRSPYADGWLIRVRPSKLSMQLKNLLTGKPAQQWQDNVRARLTQFFSAATPALMYQDGGEFVHDLSDKCSAQECDSLIKEFFHADAPSAH